MSTLGSSTRPVDEPTLVGWASTGLPMRAEAAAQGRVWHLRVARQGVWHLLVTANGAPWRFRSLKSLARRLLELNIVDLDIIHPALPAQSGRATAPTFRSRLDAGPDDPTSWDDWFKEQIELSLRDHRPGTDYREVWREADERIRKIGGLHARPKKS